MEENMIGINVKPEIMELSISALKPYEFNPRGISEEALQGLRNSLQKFGYMGLVVVNERNMQIISGHQRIKVLKEFGVESIPCIVVNVDDEYHRLMSLSLNNQQIAGYFTEALIPILEDLRKDDPESYINLRLQELREEYSEYEIEKTGKTLPDDIPPVPKEAITKPGDLWILGDHRILCGDSTKEEDVARLMDGQLASLFATDPPYCVDYTGADRPGGGKDWSGVYHEVDIPDAAEFMLKFYTCGLKFIKPNTALYLWHASKRRTLIERVCDQLNILIHQQIIWVKPCAILTYSFYSWRHEPCLLMWIKGSKPAYRPKNKSIGTVWTIDYLKSGDPATPEYYTDVWEVDWEGHKRNPGLEHPTVKPTEIFAIPMRVHTRPGEICYEPFSGSGSQIIAAERLNRRCFAMELEPVFVDVAVKRWEEFTGRKAELFQNKEE